VEIYKQDMVVKFKMDKVPTGCWGVGVHSYDIEKERSIEHVDGRR
jgi:hypothetical protein